MIFFKKKLKGFEIIESDVYHPRENTFIEIFEQIFQGCGKHGASRVAYFGHSSDLPLYVMSMVPFLIILIILLNMFILNLNKNRYLMATLQDDPNNWVDRLGFTDYNQLDVIFFYKLFVKFK